MKKTKLRELIQRPLKFHHQDIHDRINKLDTEIKEIKLLIMGLYHDRN